MNEVETPQRSKKLILGAVLGLSLLIGGNTVYGAASDLLVVLALLSGLAFAADYRLAAVRAPVLIVVAFIAALVVQQIAVAPLLLRPLAGEGEGTGWISAGGYGETVQATLVLAAALVIFLNALMLRYDSVKQIVGFLFIALLCNLAIALAQFGSAQALSVGELFGYDWNAGIFVNQNHFSTLILMAIPLLVFVALYEQRMKLAGFVLAVMMLVLLAAGSRAGIGLGFLFALLSFACLMRPSSATLWMGAATAVALGFYAYLMSAHLSFEGSVSLDTRLEFARNTLQGIADHFWNGVGLGTFQNAYQSYVSPDEIRTWYVNNAHNDYLQVVFEGGFLALAALATYLALFVRQVWRSWSDPFKRATALSIAVVLIHSAVDYPLRTMAVLFAFAFLNAALFHRGLRTRVRREHSLEVRHGGRTHLVPIHRADGG